jgi:two-component system CheB/CheR fusion protein
MAKHQGFQLRPEALAATLLAYVEEERRRIARELHDDIGQRLALLADDSDQLRRKLNVTDEANRRRLDRLVSEARALSEDLRNISHTLHPAIVEDLGLLIAIRSMARNFSERTGLPVRFQTSGDIPRDIPLDAATAIYRIAQEALRNVEKHAGETAVTVTLQGTEREVCLEITDAGHGFDPNAFDRGDGAGLGLTSMRERAYLVRGVLSVVSAAGAGTKVEVRVPLA